MPAANDVVWLSVLPDMKGFGSALTKQSSAASATAGAAAGKGFGKAALAGVAVVAGGAALAARSLYNVGKVFDDVSDTIRVGTGATGDNLDALVDSAKNVGKQVPAEFSEIGTAIADLNTRLGLTGKPLEDMAAQFLELSRITETDVATNIANVTRVFGDWNVASEDQADTLDYLFKVSQTTGIGLDDLTTKVVQFGAPLRQMGYSFEESAALLGKWEKEGVNVNAVLSGMRTGLAKFAKAGKDPVAAMADIQDAIRGAGSAGEANALAIEAFGQRAGPDMAAAIREGRFELDELMGTLGDSDETIMKAGEDTQDFSEQWLMFKNRVLSGLQPIATRFFDAVGRGMEWMNKNREAVVTTGIAVTGLVTGMAAYVAITKTAAMVSALHKAGLVASTVATGGATASTWSLNAAMRANPIGLIVTLLTGLGIALVMAYRKSETFRNIVNTAWAGIRTAISFAWNNVIKPIFKAYWAYLSNVLIPIIRFLWNNVVKPVFGFIAGHIKRQVEVGLTVFGAFRRGVGRVVDAFQAARDGIKRAWDKLGNIVRGPIDAAKRVISGFIGLINKIPGVEIKNPFSGPTARETGSDAARAARGFASGGWTGPGSKYQPAGIVHADEFVISKRARRLFEAKHPGVLNFINQTGQMPLHGGYAEGGRVIGAPLSNPHSRAQYPWATFAGDFAAPTGTAVHAWKSGVIAAVRSLTTSYGKHIRMNHTDGTSSLYAHLSRFAVSPGDRVRAGALIGNVGSTGNSTGPHLHLELMGGLYRAIGALKNAGGSIWDTLKGAGGRIDKWIREKLVGKGNVGGLFGDLGGLFKHIGGGVKDHVLGDLFDRGGEAHGVGFMAKNTIAPERVLSPSSTRALNEGLRNINRAPQMSGRITITNWEQGTGYFESIASEEAEIVFAEGMNRYDGLERQGVR